MFTIIPRSRFQKRNDREALVIRKTIRAHAARRRERKEKNSRDDATEAGNHVEEVEPHSYERIRFLRTDRNARLVARNDCTITPRLLAVRFLFSIFSPFPFAGERFRAHALPARTRRISRRRSLTITRNALTVLTAAAEVPCRNEYRCTQ